MLGLLAQDCSSAWLPSITRIVKIRIPAFLMLLQTSLLRASMSAGFVVQRFWVLRPAVRNTIYFSVSFDGGRPSGSGMPAESACHPHTRPMVRLVLPSAFIFSSICLAALKSSVSGRSGMRLQFSAGYQDAELPPGGVSLVS